ncbi:MAG TPA: WGxxGxxG family protein [Isosphaeraceae bacterium]|nr:WGxxGxxG family protein [Isosphaeraceae bacterium]
MKHPLSPKKFATSILALGLTLTLAGPASAQATNDPAGTTAGTNTVTTTRQDDHTDWGWLGLLGLLGLAGLLRRNDTTHRRSDDVTRRTT